MLSVVGTVVLDTMLPASNTASPIDPSKGFADMVQATEQQLGDLRVTPSRRPRHLEHRTQQLGLASLVKRIVVQRTIYRAHGHCYRAYRGRVLTHLCLPYSVWHGQFDLVEHTQRTLSLQFTVHSLCLCFFARLREPWALFLTCPG
jgi:hypothetical protein